MRVLALLHKSHWTAWRGDLTSAGEEPCRQLPRRTVRDEIERLGLLQEAGQHRVVGFAAGLIEHGGDLRRSPRLGDRQAENADNRGVGCLAQDRASKRDQGLDETVAVRAAFVLGRISRAIGLSMPKTVNRFRVGGIALTAFVGLTLGARLPLLALSQMAR